MKKLVFLLFFFLGIAFGQQTSQIKLSSEATFSVITCGPGSELYSTFGHNAFRLKDPVYNYDVVYNYGTFDFNTPFFYIKFARGKLPYQLGRTSFKKFVYAYKYEKRWVKEQVLNLTPEQNKTLLAFLEENYKEENRSYKYDFFYNNCATKIREIITKNFDETIVFPEDHITADKTFRDLIYDYVTKNSWSSFGIDIALGAVIDREATPLEYEFLPDYVFETFKHATLKDGSPLVTAVNVILEEPNNKQDSSSFLLSPYVIFTILMLIVLVITAFDLKNKKRTRWLDAFLFLFTGLGGIMILLLWFATDHSMTVYNWNVLWLMPINLLFIRKFLLKRKECKDLWKHSATLITLIIIMLFLWLLNLQIFAFAAIPLLIMLLVRYAYVTYYFLNCKENKDISFIGSKS
ncbi:hypothetical protein KORDIASMS9_03585 [Kordia sp. SMS9]|uniref:Lnb N-terminal periplasmic domain-containing protein n=1 Tax=Kordia sp. SMS9 TaxID=2282170 RepID=UPI000E0DD5D9|nr:DUF4105 domain-containing protein [Kordia sp. SMS9]AXG71328.1 hypothetical protein KORDIASMS9_03585 [Kordia sp. SMS9]